MGRFARLIRIVGRSSPSSTPDPRYARDPDARATSFRSLGADETCRFFCGFLLLSIWRKCVSLPLGNSRLLFDESRSDLRHEIHVDAVVGFGRDGMRARRTVLARVRGGGSRRWPI